MEGRGVSTNVIDALKLFWQQAPMAAIHLVV